MRHKKPSSSRKHKRARHTGQAVQRDPSREVPPPNESKPDSPFERGGRVTLYGRLPVLEALRDPRITPQRLFLSKRANGANIKEITLLANQVALPIERLDPLALSRISKNGRQDQGVALDLCAPGHLALDEALSQLDSLGATGPEGGRPIFLLDGLNTPGNLGMTIRGLCAANVAGIILPQRGCAPLNPLAIKASAGVALRAPIWFCDTAEHAAHLLIDHNARLHGLSADGETNLYERDAQRNTAIIEVWVLGNESAGISEAVRPLISEWVHLPMSGEVESLNAAVAASVVAFELDRQRSVTSGS